MHAKNTMIIRPVYIQNYMKLLSQRPLSIYFLRDATIIHRVGKCLTEVLIIYREEQKKKKKRSSEETPEVVQKERRLLPRSQVNPFDVKLCISLSGMR